MKLHYAEPDPMIDFGLCQLPTPCPLDSLTLLRSDSADARRYLQLHSLCVPDAQGYLLVKENSSVVLLGDPQGLMYALIDLGSALRHHLPLPSGLHNPSIPHRGIKLNIPLDARTPSYSDASDSAWANIPVMWDLDFWKEIIDLLAINKYDVISLWNLHPFPSMVSVPGYEAVALENVCRTQEPVQGALLTGWGMYSARYARDLVTVRCMTIHQKIEFWREVMAYGAKRGIHFIIFTWNTFVYGTEHTHYGITDDLSNPVTKDYFRKSVQALIDTYPLLAGIGITAGEHMSHCHFHGPDVSRDLQWLSETYGAGINDALQGAQRPFHFIHRQHMSGTQEILKAFKGLQIPVEFGFKYSKAHMYSSPQPCFGNDFFASLPEGKNTWLTLRNDDMYMLRWGGVEFAREYLKGIPRDHTAGFLMGPDGYTLGRDFLSRSPAFKGRPVLDRQWYSTAIWGRLAYNTGLSDEYFIATIRERTDCSPEDAQWLFGLCEAASHIIPLVNQVHWHDCDYQNYPELNISADCSHTIIVTGSRVRFRGIHDYILTPAQDGCPYEGVSETCEREMRGESLQEGKHTADDAVNELHMLCNKVERLLDRISLPEFDHNAEFQGLQDDCSSMMKLGRFYAAQLECALTTRRVYQRTHPHDVEHAIRLAQEIVQYWEDYINDVLSRYYPQRLTRFDGLTDVSELHASACRNVQDVRQIVDPELPYSS